MKEKFWNWWNRPITWGESVKYSVWGTLISMIGCLAWLFGLGVLNKKVELAKQKREEMKKEKEPKKSKYYEVLKPNDVEE
jgi:hypothetical protein